MLSDKHNALLYDIHDNDSRVQVGPVINQY